MVSSHAMIYESLLLYDVFHVNHIVYSFGEVQYVIRYVIECHLVMYRHTIYNVMTCQGI